MNLELDGTNPLMGGANIMSTHTVKHMMMTWLFTHLYTGIWYVDILITMLMGSVIGILYKLLGGYEEIGKKIWQFIWGNSPINDANSITIRSEIAHNLSTGAVQYLHGSSVNTKDLINAIFYMLNKEGKISVAMGDLQNPQAYRSGNNQYKDMLNKILHVRPLSNTVIQYNDDITIDVRGNNDTKEGSKRAASGSADKALLFENDEIMITSRTGFKACYDFLNDSYKKYVEFEYKKFDNKADEDCQFLYEISDIEGDTIIWSRYKLRKLRDMNTVYYEGREDVQRLIKEYLAKPPGDKLGFLLYGRPGCGKTSFIKAVAYETKKHIFSVPPNKIETDKLARILFFDSRVTLNNLMGTDQHYGARLDTILVPTEDRMYIMEDIDALKSVARRSENAEYKRNFDGAGIIPDMDMSEYIDSMDSIQDEYSNEEKEVDATKLINDLYAAKPINYKVYDMGFENYDDDDDPDFDTYADATDRACNNRENEEEAKEKKKTELLSEIAKCKAAGINIDNIIGTLCGDVVSGPANFVSKDKFSLSTFLNLLDGLVSIESIIIMTSNHPEKLDPALIRLGRIDKRIYFGKLSNTNLFLMMQRYYPEVTVDILQDSLHPNWVHEFHDKIAPNDLENICKNKSFNDTCTILKKMLERINELSEKKKEERRNKKLNEAKNRELAKNQVKLIETTTDNTTTIEEVKVEEVKTEEVKVDDEVSSSNSESESDDDSNDDEDDDAPDEIMRLRNLALKSADKSMKREQNKQESKNKRKNKHMGFVPWPTGDLDNWEDSLQKMKAYH
jgi:SpoVK/Ycf46/Vps4 family AAA+-type ATPase